MAFERFIAFRYLITKQRFGFMTVISWISIIGVTIGVAAIVVILSVFNGFSGLVTTILVNFDPHIRIERIQPASYEEFSNAEEYVKNQKDVISVGPFVQGKAMIIHRSAVRVINVRGIETKSAKPFAGISKNIVLGEFDFEGSNTKGIVLGFTLADRLGAVIGDTLSIVSPAGFEFAFLQLGQPIIRRFKVIGIYESNNKDYDLFYSYVNLSMAQELFHMNKMISGLEVRLSNFEFAPMYKNKIQAQLGNGFRIFSWYDLHRDLYTVMKI